MSNMRNQRDWFKNCLNNKMLVDRLKKVSFLICDIDGVLTDGKMYYSDNKTTHRSFSILDGYIFAQAQKVGLKVALISGKKHDSAYQRAEHVGIPLDCCLIGNEEKVPLVKKLLDRYDQDVNNVVFVGDDWIDIRIKKAMPGIFLTLPHDAPFYFHYLANLIIPSDGGHHAVRLFLDFLLFVQEKHFAQGIIAECLSI